MRFLKGNSTGWAIVFWETKALFYGKSRFCCSLWHLPTKANHKGLIKSRVHIVPFFRNFFGMMNVLKSMHVFLEKKKDWEEGATRHERCLFIVWCAHLTTYTGSTNECVITTRVKPNTICGVSGLKLLAARQHITPLWQAGHTVIMPRKKHHQKSWFT